jgi:large repetitive protein
MPKILSQFIIVLLLCAGASWGQPSITTTSPLPNGVAGSPYNLPLNAIGGFPPYTWSVITGTLPSGFVLSGTVISGTSLTTGTSIFTLLVKDMDGASAFQQFSLTIDPAASPFTITTTSPLPPGQVGTQYAQTLAARELLSLTHGRWSAARCPAV